MVPLQQASQPHLDPSVTLSSRLNPPRLFIQKAELPFSSLPTRRRASIFQRTGQGLVWRSYSSRRRSLTGRRRAPSSSITLLGRLLLAGLERLYRMLLLLFLMMGLGKVALLGGLWQWSLFPSPLFRCCWAWVWWWTFCRYPITLGLFLCIIYTDYPESLSVKQNDWRLRPFRAID